MKVLSESKEEMLGRKKAVYKMDQKSVTPARAVLQKKIADLNKTNPKLVVVTKIESVYGKNEFIIHTEIYNDKKSYDLCVSKSMAKKSEIKESEENKENTSKESVDNSEKEAKEDSSETKKGE
ncbi:MAG: hypothetical protein ACOCP8_08775 [archaeon]